MIYNSDMKIVEHMFEDLLPHIIQKYEKDFTVENRKDIEKVTNIFKALVNKYNK